MKSPDSRFDICSESALLDLFAPPSQVSLVKELDHIDANYAAWIAAAPFFVLCTAGDAGLDASPRGDAAGFGEVMDSKTLLIPDRRGNNRIDSLRNLMVDPRVALLFLIPGLGEALRVNGRARVNADPTTVSRFEVYGVAPKLVLVVTVEAVYFQCSRAVVRGSLPSPGKILKDATAGEIDGGAYDRQLPARIKSTLHRSVPPNRARTRNARSLRIPSRWEDRFANRRVTSEGNSRYEATAKRSPS